MCSCAGQTYTLAHKCSIMLELAPNTSRRLSVTQLYLACQILPMLVRVCVCVCVRLCATVGPGRLCGSQLQWLGSEHSIMEAEQRDLIEALKSWKRFLWSRAVTVRRPAPSSQTGFYWTGAVSAAIKQRGDRDRKHPGTVMLI